MTTTTLSTLIVATAWLFTVIPCIAQEFTSNSVEERANDVNYSLMAGGYAPDETADSSLFPVPTLDEPNLASQRPNAYEMLSLGYNPTTDAEVEAALSNLHPPSYSITTVIKGPDWDLFDAGEWHIQAGYSYITRSSSPEYRDTKDDGNGFFLGAHKYLHRFFSAGLDYMYGEGMTDNTLAGTLQVRVPLDEFSSALCLSGGAGAIFSDGSHFMGHLGLGLEIRLYKHLSFDMAFRVIESDGNRQFHVVTAGFSCVF